MFEVGLKVKLIKLSPSAPHYERLAREGQSLAERTHAAMQLSTADELFASDIAIRGIEIGDVGIVTQAFGDGWVAVWFERTGYDMHVAEALLEEVTEV